MCQGNFRYLDGSGNLISLTPAGLTNLDPRGIGIDPAMLDLVGHTAYLDKTFCTGKTVTNDTPAGHGFKYAGFAFRAPIQLRNDVFNPRPDYRITANGTHPRT